MCTAPVERFAIIGGGRQGNVWCAAMQDVESGFDGDGEWRRQYACVGLWKIKVKEVNKEQGV